MSPVERLQAAIEKLEQQRAATEPVRSDSEWVVDYEVGETMRFITVLDSHNGGHDGSIVAADVTSEARAQLIVTLHRTIDAQLAILREALFQLEGAPARAGFIGNEFNLFMRLADAILGSDQ